MTTLLEQAMRKAVVYCVDPKGLPMALFSAHQVAQLNRKDRDFDIVICGIHDLEIPEYFQTLGIRSKLISVKDEVQTLALNPEHHFTHETLLRLWLPSCFADEYDRLLYLDYDTFVISNSLSEFMDLNLGPHAIGAVRDVVQLLEGRTKPFDIYEEAGIKGKKYFNSGVMLIDVQKYNDQGLLKKSLETRRLDYEFRLQDQSMINLVLQGEWAELHPAWNWQLQGGFPGYEKYCSPHILHFITAQKPWSEATDSQQRVTLRVVNEYLMFFQTHFPDWAFERIRVADSRTGLWDAFQDLIDHLQKLPRLYLAMRDFDSDMDVLL